MVAGEQGVLLRQSEGEMVGRVAGRVERFQPPAGTFHGIAFVKLPVGGVILVGARLEALISPETAAGRCDAARSRRSAHPWRLDRPGGRRMVLVGVGDQDMRDGLAPHRVEQGLDMARQVGAGVDDGDVAGADDIAAGAREGIGPPLPATTRRTRGLTRTHSPDRAGGRMSKMRSSGMRESSSCAWVCRVLERIGPERGPRFPAWVARSSFGRRVSTFSEMAPLAT